MFFKSGCYILTFTKHQLSQFNKNTQSFFYWKINIIQYNCKTKFTYYFLLLMPF